MSHWASLIGNLRSNTLRCGGSRQTGRRKSVRHDCWNNAFDGRNLETQAAAWRLCGFVRVCGGERGPAWDVGSFRSHSRPKPCVGSAPNLPSDAVAAGIARDRVKLGWIRANRFGCAKRTGQAGSVSSEFSNLPGGRRRAQCRPLPAQARPREPGLGAASFPRSWAGLRVSRGEAHWNGAIRRAFCFSRCP